MSILDAILSKVGGDSTVANLAAKVGLAPEQVEQAVGALAQSHAEPGDTIQGAAEKTGLDTGILNQIVGHIGGEGSLGRYASELQSEGLLGKVTGFLDRDGDGNPLNDITGAVSGLFKKS